MCVHLHHSLTLCIHSVYVCALIGRQVTRALDTHLSSPQAKLSTQSPATALVWVCDGVLASCSGEGTVRLWDFERGENYQLFLPGEGEELVTTIAYNSRKGRCFN